MGAAVFAIEAPEPATVEEVLLDIAEELFSRRGYDGTSVRDITTAAGLNVCSVSHYFGGKAALFLAVLERRAPVFRALTLAALEEANAIASGSPSIEAIVAAYVGPSVRLIASGHAGWARYLRLQSSIKVLSDRPEFTAPVYERYRPIHAAYLKALRAALPAWSEEGARWGFYQLQLALSGFVNRDHGAAAAPEWHPRLSDPDKVIARMSRTFAAGFAAAVEIDPAAEATS